MKLIKTSPECIMAVCTIGGDKGRGGSVVSGIIMGFLALIVSRLTPNIYKAIVLSLVIVFFYYTANTLCGSMGEKGLLSPIVGAWFADIFFCCACILWLSWPSFARRLSRIRAKHL